MHAIDFTTGRVNNDSQFIPVRGDAFKVRRFTNGKAKMIYARTFNQQGAVNVFWSLYHPHFFDGAIGFQDFQNLVTGSTKASGGNNEIPRGFGEPVYSDDEYLNTFLYPANGTWAGVYAVYYEDLPGIQTSLYSASEVLKHAQRSLHLDTLLTPTIAGDYSTFNFTVAETRFKHLSGNKKYAIIGAISDDSTSFIRFKHSSTGGLPIVLHNPNTYDENYSQNFLLVLSQEQGDLPIIPVFQGNEQLNMIFEVFSFVLTANADYHVYCLELDF